MPLLYNAWYYLALDGRRLMAELLGDADQAAEDAVLQRRLAEAFNNAFWTDRGYRSPDHEGPTDDRGNALAVVAGITGPDQQSTLLRVLRDERHASPYLEKYVLEALVRMGRPDDAFDRMLQRYKYMLSDGLTTLWEFFDPFTLEGFGDLGRGTYNHAWSGGPLTVLSQHVAGVAPTEAGWRRYEVAPTLGRLRYVEARAPTPHGVIDLRIDRDDGGGMTVQIDSPPGAEGVAALPAAPNAVVLLDGRPVASTPDPDGRVRVAVPKGRSTLTLRTETPDS